MSIRSGFFQGPLFGGNGRRGSNNRNFTEIVEVLFLLPVWICLVTWCLLASPLKRDYLLPIHPARCSSCHQFLLDGSCHNWAFTPHRWTGTRRLRHRDHNNKPLNSRVEGDVVFDLYNVCEAVTRRPRSPITKTPPPYCGQCDFLDTKLTASPPSSIPTAKVFPPPLGCAFPSAFGTVVPRVWRHRLVDFTKVTRIPLVEGLVVISILPCCVTRKASSWGHET